MWEIRNVGGMHLGKGEECGEMAAVPCCNSQALPICLRDGSVQVRKGSPVAMWELGWKKNWECEGQSEGESSDSALCPAWELPTSS